MTKKQYFSFIALSLALMLLIITSVLLFDFGITYKHFKDECNESGGFILPMNKTVCYYPINNEPRCFTWIV
jgi:hypothetical protein